MAIEEKQYIIINKNLLLDMVNTAVRIINKKSPIFDLKNIYILFRNNILQICSTDIDNYIIINNVTSGSELDLCVTGNIILPIIKQLNDEVILEKVNNNLIIKDKFGEFSIKYSNSNGFPKKIIDNSILTNILTIDALVFNKLLKSILINVTEEDFGICRFTINNNILNIVINDRKRLSFVNHNLTEDNTYTNTEIILNYKTIVELTNTLSGNLAIKQHNNEIIFEYQNYTLISRIINSKHIVDYTKFMNLGQSCCKVNVKEFIKAVQRSLIMSQIISKIVYLNFQNNNLEVCGIDISVGKSVVNIPITGNLNSNITVNGSFLLNVLSCIQMEECTIYLESINSPMVIHGEGFHVLMPIKISRGFNV